MNSWKNQEGTPRVVLDEIPRRIPKRAHGDITEETLGRIFERNPKTNL